MPLTIQELIKILQQIAPDSLAENWDNVGLLVGSPEQKVKAILLALDPSPELIRDAVDKGCNLIITHHPVIFRPIKALRTDQPTGHFIAEAIQHSIGVIGCHTNLDATIGGVSDVLADGLGVQDTRPLVAGAQGCESENMCGLGRIGSYPEPISPQEFIKRVCDSCKPPWLLEAGSRPETVSTVAVCGGSCSDFAETALALGADVFITAEIKHSVARWAEDAGLWIIDGGHFATEYPAITVLKDRLVQELGNTNIEIATHVASQQSPLRLVEESLPGSTIK